MSHKCFTSIACDCKCTYSFKEIEKDMFITWRVVRISACPACNKKWRNINISKIDWKEFPKYKKKVQGRIDKSCIKWEDK
jgi:hypothetical protein